MQQFKMRGKAITGPVRYRENFCPEQLLRQKETAAGFFYQHFCHLSDVCKYHTEMFCEAALIEKGERNNLSFFTFQGYNTRMSQYGPFKGENISLRKALLRQYLHDEQQSLLMQEMWQISRNAASLSEGDRNRLFCLLTAGYSLAGKTLQECPITAAAAENAFLKRTDAKATMESWLVIPESGDICLEARREPYRILMTAGARERLQAGQSITQRKFVALPHIQHSSGISVTLWLYTHEKDQEPKKLTVDVGDFCYANFVGNVPVWFHPAMEETETCRIERRKHRITYTNKLTGQSEVLENSAVEPVGFAAEQNNAGWLLMYGGKLSDARYSGRNNYTLRKEGIVQVGFRGNKCLLLDKYGTVYTNYGEKYPNQLISLDEFKR